VTTQRNLIVHAARKFEEAARRAEKVGDHRRAAMLYKAAMLVMYGGNSFQSDIKPTEVAAPPDGKNATCSSSPHATEDAD
jgi:hypothetical protein